MIALSLAIAPPAEGRVRMVSDESEAVLRILDIESKGAMPTDKDWAALFATDGYRRLKERELGMKRKFEDDDFRAFVGSADLIANREVLRTALDAWEHADVRECQARALAYLPKGADITAKVYILIKPLKNSFVWGIPDDPAIMLYLDPAKSKEAFTNTVAHEMHHIGYGRSCPSKAFKDWLEKQSEARKTAYLWLGAFGEGFAVLAAAPGLNGSPEGTAAADVQADWAHGMANQPEQFRDVETFFLQVLDGKLDSSQAAEKARDFYGIVGPWYTVGYTMATTIEKVYGRTKLIACYQDPRLLIPTYQAAATRLTPSPPLWSHEFVDGLK